MTPEQIKNWRDILCMQLGPYALIMSDADIIAYRDMMQAKVDSLNPDDYREEVVETPKPRKQEPFNTSMADKLTQAFRR